MTSFEFTTLPWHPAAHHLIRGARAGDDSLFLVGPPGTGKTELLMHHVSGQADAVDRADDASPVDDSGVARSLLYVLLGRVNTPALLLSSILGAARQPVSARLRRKGTTYLLQHVADWMAKKNVGALALDEVQHASSDALFHAMLLIDACAQSFGHPLGLILVGTPNAAAIVRDTGQMGQRVPVEFAVPLLAPEEIVALCEARPAFAALRRAGGTRRWDALMHDVVTKAGGSIRRLTQMLLRAERLAAMAQARLTEQHVRLALDAQVD